VRAGIVAAVIGGDALLRRIDLRREATAVERPASSEPPAIATSDTGQAPPRSARSAAARKAAPAVITAGIAVTIGSNYLRRRLENRWMKRLADRGHRRPAVALGVRVAAMYAAYALALKPALDALEKAQRGHAGE